MSEHDYVSQTADASQTAQVPAKKASHLSKILVAVSIILLLLLVIGGSILLVALRRLRGGERIPIVSRDSEYVVQTMEDTLVFVDGTDGLGTEDVGDGPEETEDPADSSQEPPAPKPPVPIYQQNKNNPDVLNILLLGRDSRSAAVERGRTDAMIILSYNKKTRDVKMLSLMRDTLVPIEGHDWNRINTAYGFGGVGLCINTVNTVFQLDIQDYITIDFNGLVGLIDSIGGIDISLTADEVYLYRQWGRLGKDATAGVYHMDGKFALAHASNRTLGNDFERTRRQRDILMAIFTRITETRSIGDLAELINSSLDMVKTNLSITNLLSLAADVMTHSKDLSIETASMPFADTYRGGIYKKMYIINIDIPQNTRLIHEFLYQN
ncbi:MAG: LCP family protein [Clostridia bacterium]|nr:LCP family protein [Clostridia bacterium]